MQKERLTLKLPMEPLALRHAGEMLLGLAASLDGATSVTVTLEDALPPAADLLPLAAAPAAAELPPPAAELPPPAAPAGVTLDDAKRPWDIRIHGSGKTFLKTGPRTGCWKYKKNLDAALIASVEAELDAAMAAAAAPAAPAALPPAAVPPVTAPPAAVPPAGTVPPPPVTTETTETTEPPAMDFPGIVNKVTALQNEGRITPDQIQAVVIAAGLPSFPLLGSRPDLIPTVNAEIDKLCPPIQ